MQNRRQEIIGILLLIISLCILASLIGFNPSEEPRISPNVKLTNTMGIVGIYVSYGLIKLGFGYSVIILPLLGFVWGWWLFSHRKLENLYRTTLYLIGAMILISISLGQTTIWIYEGNPPHVLYSGFSGWSIANLFHNFLGGIGVSVILAGGWLLLIRGYFSWSFYHPFQIAGKWIQDKWNSFSLERELKKKEKSKQQHTQELVLKIEEKKEEDYTETIEKKEKITSVKENNIKPTDEKNTLSEIENIDVHSSKEEKTESGMSDDKEDIEVGEMVEEEEVPLDKLKERKAPKREYQLPTTELLDSPLNIQDGMSRDELLERANFLTKSLETFGVEGKVVNVHPGPVITLFEVEPAEGVRVNKFVQLSDDLARVMEASRVRVIAPIPGKSSVGIEIPNRDPALVYYKSIVNSEKFASSKSLLTLAIGKSTSGEIETLNLGDMPHLLIAGTTGSGKSVCLNTIICSILYRAKPDEVRFMIIDPKKVEMTMYRSLEKYFLIRSADFDEPIVTTTENAILALKGLEKEMDNRYTILSEVVVRNIDEYNKKMKSENQPIMPYIILVIDELADLMMMSAKDVEAPIARLAQLARAVGIHLVIATQRPSVDVITGVIKENFPSRISFQVATKIDSRTIIDTSGAEKLIGRGDMLFVGLGSAETVRLHNAFLSLEEIQAIMNHIITQPEGEELTLPSIKEFSSGDLNIGGDEQDEMLSEAIKLVVIHQQGSISLLQRRLKLGYSRAARLMDEMEKIGIVGPFTGSKAREVLVDESYLEMIS
ncbi:MAG: DNA translocase FtsK 4TM domain-containing protein, partial [Candidatus Neomarinimicrobiota bacterium]|nr:DNA translocase FtsK 4TM domain-containing protein [Candidatus Neomarinimicrobiota bacterium]